MPFDSSHSNQVGNLSEFSDSSLRKDIFIVGAAKIKTKRKGNRLERRARDILRQSGYLVAKTGGSLGLFDLIAENRNGIRHVQVKANRLPRPVEREDMVAIRPQLPANSTIEVWVFYNGQREPRIELL